MSRVYLVASIVLTMLLSGCAWWQKEQPAPPPPPSQIGVLDWDKAWQAHPDYAKWQELRTELQALEAEVAAAQEMELAKRQVQPAPPVPLATAGDHEQWEQIYQSKLQEKQAELAKAFEAAKAQEIEALKPEWDAFVKSIEEPYKAKLFDLNLKNEVLLQHNRPMLETLRPGEEKRQTELAEELKLQRDALQQEYQQQLTQKQQEMAQRLAAKLEPLRQEQEQAFAAYQQAVVAELQAMAAQQTSLTPAALPSVKDDAAAANAGGQNLMQRLAAKEQEFTLLQAKMEQDLVQKTAQIAGQKQLKLVMRGVITYVNAVDITNMVIEECQRR